MGVHQPLEGGEVQDSLALLIHFCSPPCSQDFSRVAASLGSTTTLNGEDGVEQTAIKVSLSAPSHSGVSSCLLGPRCKHGGGPGRSLPNLAGMATG